MSSRHGDFRSGTIGRLSPATFNQTPLCNTIRQGIRATVGEAPSPPSDSSNSPATAPRCATPIRTVSMLEKQAASTYSGKKTQLPLSVYELPTATYMWPRWTPRAEEPTPRDPVIFVKYRPPQSDSDSNSAYSRAPSRASPMTVSSHPSPASTPPPLSYSRKRSSSADSDAESLPSPSDRFLKLPRVSHSIAPSNVLLRQNATLNVPSAPVSRVYPLQLTDKETARTHAHGHTFGIDSDCSDVELRPATFPYPAYQSNSSRAGTMVPRSLAPVACVPGPSAPRVEQEDDSQKVEWMRYTYPSPETSAGPDFKCVWEVRQRDGMVKQCGYSSKKHLVKRHIESKHLQLRPCLCMVCGKRFAQKSNLDTHLNTHTGVAPHKCHYCDEFFKDPARRHRHMIQVHQHRSSRTKKGRMFVDPGAGSSVECSEPDIEDLTTPPPA